jgi:hypothetical protein
VQVEYQFPWPVGQQIRRWTPKSDRPDDDDATNAQHIRRGAAVTLSSGCIEVTPLRFSNTQQPTSCRAASDVEARCHIPDNTIAKFLAGHPA